MNKITITGFLLVSVFSIYLFTKNENVDVKYNGKVEVSEYESFSKESSFIKTNYYSEKERKLIIGIKNTSYQYCNVPKSIWVSYKNSESLGKYYNKNIKNKFSCE